MVELDRIVTEIGYQDERAKEVKTSPLPDLARVAMFGLSLEQIESHVNLSIKTHEIHYDSIGENLIVADGNYQNANADFSDIIKGKPDNLDLLDKEKTRLRLLSPTVADQIEAVAEIGITQLYNNFDEQKKRIDQTKTELENVLKRAAEVYYQMPIPGEVLSTDQVKAIYDMMYSSVVRASGAGIQGFRVMGVNDTKRRELYVANKDGIEIDESAKLEVREDYNYVADYLASVTTLTAVTFEDIQQYLYANRDTPDRGFDLNINKTALLADIGERNDVSRILTSKGLELCSGWLSHVVWEEFTKPGKVSSMTRVFQTRKSGAPAPKNNSFSSPISQTKARLDLVWD